MFSRLSYEVCLKIFHYVFANSWNRKVIRVEEKEDRITYSFPSKDDERQYTGAFSFLDDAVAGKGAAASVAEALYKSNIMFAVDAKILCTFLQRCPFSRAVEPGKYIKTVLFYMDEDPNFIGDGEDEQALRKADWVDLESDAGHDTVSRQGHRTELMRQCWRAILKMPQLKRFEFWIMPSQGKVSANDIQCWEIRDIIPTHFRLCLNDVDVFIYLRTWGVYQKPITTDARWLDQNNDFTADEDGLCESHVDLSTCIPYNCNELMYQENFLIPQEHHDHAIRNCAAVQHLIERLKADKNYEVTNDGDIRRTRKHASGDSLIDAGS